MTILDLLQSDDFANIKLAAIIATPEQFHEAILGLLELFTANAITKPKVVYTNNYDDLLLLSVSMSTDQIEMWCRYSFGTICQDFCYNTSLRNYLQNLDEQLRHWTASIQKRILSFD